PIGVASLGQVHRAVLRNGSSVAIKVQRPNVRQKLKTDLRLLRLFAKVIDFLPIFKDDFDGFIEEFRFWTMRELDYLLEASNSKVFSDLYGNNPNVSTPKVYWDMTTVNILTTEYVDGVSMKEILADVRSHPEKEEISIRGYHFKRQRIIELGVDLLYTQFFKHGFIHGDPHPSNILFSEGHHMHIIDFGIVGKMTKSQMALFMEILKSLVTRDYQKLTRLLISMDQVTGVDDPDKLENEVKQMLDKFDTSSIQEASPTALLLEMSWRANSLNIQFPKYFTLIGKVYSIYDGVIQSLDPFKSLLDHFEPLFERAVASEIEENFDLRKLSLEIYNMLSDYKKLVIESPAKIRDLFHELHRDGIPIRLVDNSSHNTERQAEEVTDSRVKIKEKFHLLLTFVLLGAVTIFMVYVLGKYDVPVSLVVLFYSFTAISIIVGWLIN
ncbi:hypothetical protein GF357_00100, partial [Candidatus Dojkabacteria bacterium]|nr:hypothetical protein [Candidatus Dojkabacteria bacterium]